jgi:hypothetical protein
VLQFVNAIVTQLQAVVDIDVPVEKESTTRWLWEYSVLHYIRSWENQPNEDYLHSSE